MRTTTLLTCARFAKEGEAFAPVSLPHTWNAKDGQDGGNDYWRGVGTYQIDLPDPTDGKRQFIEFKGANHVATVYCNGRLLGQHKGGFSTFRFDLTAAMRPTGNVLRVDVSNAPSDIYPQTADFTFFGGLYREVSFIETAPAHFDLLKTGTNAVFVTPMVSGTTRLDLFPVDAGGCTVSVDLKDASDAVVASASAPAEAHTVLTLSVKAPHLWNGMADPYCYTAEASLLRGDEVLDTVAVDYGYRSFHVDPNTGFWLNGKNTPLHGVARHQDRLDKGWAISRADHEEDIALIKEVGANTVRLAHYQHDQYFYDLCDHTGFVVWAEIPFISRFIPGQEAHDNTLSQMTELVAQNYNHPSIFFWGISNEILIGKDREDLRQNLREVNALAKRLDPSRMTTMAQVTMTPMESEHNIITDVESYNHYFGWYFGEAADNGPWLDQFHAMYPDRCLGVSEYGAEAILKWHSAYPENHDYTEEYACEYHHDMLKTFATRPYLWATHLWNMFDFAADGRDEGGVQGRNNKGLVTYDRKTKKDAFYLYKAYWTTEPMLHVRGARFVDRAPGERNVTVYTNCPSVTLILNGAEAATLEAVDHAAVFKDVPLKDGPNTVSARCGDVASNTIILNGVAEHNYAYDLPEGNDAANWFDDPKAREARKPLNYPEGFYSIKDKVTDLLANSETAAIIHDAMEVFSKSSMMSMMGSSKEDGAGGIMGTMRLTDMMKMAGKSFSADVKRQINDALTKIRKG